MLLPLLLLLRLLLRLLLLHYRHRAAVAAAGAAGAAQVLCCYLLLEQTDHAHLRFYICHTLAAKDPKQFRGATVWWLGGFSLVAKGLQSVGLQSGDYSLGATRYGSDNPFT